VTKMAGEKAELGYCPNCGKPAIKEGNKITCEECDAVFRVTQDGARLEKTGVIKDHERRIAQLEGRLKPETQSESDESEEDDI